jgi:type II secretory pathway pseudopilin PulG
VLVATVIMAIAVVGLLANLSTSLRTGARVTDYDKAAAVARERMNELLLDQKAPRFQPIEGRLDPTLTGWKDAGWKAEIRPFDPGPQPAANAPVLDEVALEIWWNAGGQRKTYRLQGYRRGYLRPEEAEIVAQMVAH